MAGRIAFALLASFTGFASPASAPNYYFTHTWHAEDGLPQNQISAIVQTRDGYLWVGTYSGLARFDGVRFVVFDNNNTPEMHSSRVTSLFEDNERNLWIGYETGELTRYRDGTFRYVEMAADWNGRKIVAITADRSGDIWTLGADGMIARVRDKLVLAPESGNATDVIAMARDRGTLWILRNGKLSQLENGRLKAASFDPESTDDYVQGICASREGGVWIAGNGRLRKWHDGKWTLDYGPIPWGSDAAPAFMETHDRNLAAGIVDRGLNLIRPGGRVLHFDRNNGLPSDWVRAVCEDREGNLWAGTGYGLTVLRAGKVATVNPPDQWQNRPVLSISAARDGSVWVGTEGAGLYQFNKGAWNRFGTEHGFSNLFVWSTSQDAEGRVWAGTWGGGLFVQRGGHFERPPGLEEVTTPMPALLQLPDGSAWIGTFGGGLMRYKAGEVNSFGPAEGLQFPDVRAVVQDAEGAIWFGTLGGGLGCLKNDTLKQFRKTDGLSSDFVQCLRFDPDGSLWIGTSGGGLNRLKDGRFAAINTSHGLPNNTICHIEDDDRGNLWFSSHNGIFRVSREELNLCADGRTNSVHCLAYGKGDGLPTLECSGGSQPAGCKTADGRLWFPTSKGIAVVDPNEVRINQRPPPVVIEELLVDGRRVPRNAGDIRLRIRPGQNRFQFHFTGLSFVVPEKVRFKYRLEGLENEWREENERQVTYNYIPPGDYTFRVIACNNDEVWNTTGAALSFTLLPHFWQTWWFRVVTGALAVLAASSVVWFDMRRRMHRKLELLERQRAVERERERIARDIHDDLGASLTRITMLSQPVHGEPDPPGQAADNLSRIYGTARELTRAMDEIVWAVNPKHDTLDSLASYLGRFAQDFLGAAKLRCRLDLPVQLPGWHLTAEVRHNLFLAFKEALHNVVKHAAATEVRVSLSLSADGFSLVVEDNGRSFPLNGSGAPLPADAARIAPGNGLPNMRRRLEEIKGRCEVQSGAGTGTRVKFTVPVRVESMT